jgi:hypothetical protein
MISALAADRGRIADIEAQISLVSGAFHFGMAIREAAGSGATRFLQIPSLDSAQ